MVQGKEEYRIDKLAADVAALVKALGYESCVLVGHDWGGLISWLAAHTYDSLIDQLVIMAAPHPKVSYDWDQYKRSVQSRDADSQACLRLCKPQVLMTCTWGWRDRAGVD